jgi:hypothetical protein
MGREFFLVAKLKNWRLSLAGSQGISREFRRSGRPNQPTRSLNVRNVNGFDFRARRTSTKLMWNSIKS